MSELRPDDHARIRRAFRFIDESAPLAPDLAEVGVLTATPGRAHRRPIPTVVAALAVTLAALTPMLFLGGGEDNPILPPVGAVPTTAEPTTTTSQPASTGQRLPLDGQPGDLGVKSIEFMAAVFPTSPQEHRVSAAWQAVRVNVESSWVETCMAGGGFAVEMPRILAVDMRRNGDMPDFELDAALGILGGVRPETPAPPQGSSVAEAAAWQDAYTRCSVEVEAKRSEQFDQLIGPIRWWHTVDEVNTSPEMTAVTSQMLSCVAAEGGPQVDTIKDLYSDSLTQAAPDLETARKEAFQLAQVINACAGDYNQVRKSLLVPARERIQVEYEQVLTEAEAYFNSVLTAAGIAVP